MLCIPGDCPALDPREVEELLADDGNDGRDAATVVIVPDRHGTGTNGLLLAPPEAIPPSFGPGSCERHRELARVAGAACRLAQPASLLLDIDTGEDLAELRRRLAGERRHAPRTRAVLGPPPAESAPREDPGRRKDPERRDGAARAGKASRAA